VTLTDPGPDRTAPGYHQALNLDDTNPLHHYRDRFVHADRELTYLGSIRPRKGRVIGGPYWT
jgi:hypothetical protein